MYGIKYNGKHSYDDFGLTLAPGKHIGIPNKEKIKIKVPFSNVEYDFSEIYGSQTYTPRPLTYLFNIFDKNNFNKQKMNMMKIEFINFLMNSNGKQKLYDDAIPGYYFLAEVEGNSSFNEDKKTGILTVNFTAYPFMIAEHPEGHDIWDDINFDLDVLQPVEFSVNGSLTINLQNVGVPDLNPTIKSTSEMIINIRNKTFNVPSGESQSSDFILKSGENEMTIIGNGTISFLFYKELI